MDVLVFFIININIIYSEYSLKTPKIVVFEYKF